MKIIRRIKRKNLFILLSILLIIFLVVFFTFFNPFLKFSSTISKAVELELYEDYTLEKVTASYFGKDVSDKIKVTGYIDTNKTGEYILTYTVKSGFTYKKESIKVLVKDKISPVISLVGEASVNVCSIENYKEEGYTAIDNYDGDITDKVSTVNNDGVITYKIKDSSNNESVIKRTLVEVDEEYPKISLTYGSTVSIKVNTTYKDSGYEATDNCDGDLTDEVKITGNVDTTKTGNYYVTYTVTDSKDNETSLKRKVVVYNPVTNTNDYSNIVSGPTYIKGILLVNKKYSLPSDFSPGIDATANSALQELILGAKASGHTITLVSSYRSYSRQTSLYNSYVNLYGVTKADTISARAGHSEHQTGLAFDVGNLNSSFGGTTAGKWLAANCHKYGFIIRYQEGKEKITGYSYEPWHIRYLGVSVATEIFNSGVTLEEYLGVAN